MAEVLGLRTRRNKTFSDAGIFSEVACLSTLHYEGVVDSGVYDTEVDAAPTRVDTAGFDGWRITAADWHYALGRDLASHGDQDGWVGFGGRQGVHWFKFRLLRAGYLHWPTRAWQDVGGVPTYDRGNLSRENKYREIHPGSTLCLASVADWGSIWTTPGGGSVDVSWHASGGGLKEIVTVNEAARDWIATNAPPTTSVNETWFGFVFRLDWSDISQVVRDGVVQDMDGDWATVIGLVELRDALDRVLALLPVGRVRVAGQKQRGALLRKRFWRGEDGRHYLLVGVRCDVLNDLPSGDLHFDPTVTPQVAAGDDDAHVWPAPGADCDETNFELTIGNDQDPDWSNVGMRFTLNVPAGATVSVAKLTFVANGNTANDTVRTSIHYEDANDPGDFAGCNFAGFQGRVRSAASIDWDFVTDWTDGNSYDTDDFAAVVEALLAEAYWASGEHCVVFVDDDGSDNNAHRYARSADLAGGGDAPVLTVTYAVAGVGQPMMLRATTVPGLRQWHPRV